MLLTGNAVAKAFEIFTSFKRMKRFIISNLPPILIYYKLYKTTITATASPAFTIAGPLITYIPESSYCFSDNTRAAKHRYINCSIEIK